MSDMLHKLAIKALVVIEKKTIFIIPSGGCYSNPNTQGERAAAKEKRKIGHPTVDGRWTVYYGYLGLEARRTNRWTIQTNIYHRRC